MRGPFWPVFGHGGQLVLAMPPGHGVIAFKVEVHSQSIGRPEAERQGGHCLPDHAPHRQAPCSLVTYTRNI